MNMKNENAKLVFIYALLGSVESCTDVTHKVPAKVYFNFPIPDLDIGDQKAVLTELKKRKIIANFKLDDGDFVVSKPSRSMLSDFYFKLKDKPAPKPEKPVDTRIRLFQFAGVAPRPWLVTVSVTSTGVPEIASPGTTIREITTSGSAWLNEAV